VRGVADAEVALLPIGHSSTSSVAAPRVLHVITPSRMAGAETFLSRLMGRTNPADVVQHCISSRTAATVEMRVAGMKFETLGISGKLNLLALPRIRAAARDFQADLLHSHLSTASWWCGWLERLGGPPSIGHVHGFTSSFWHSRQSHLVACSQAVRRDLIQKGIQADRVSVIHYPVDPNDQRRTRLPQSVRDEFGVDAATPVVGTFAHLSIKKGYRELIRAAGLVLNHVPNAQFWCVGEGPLRGELQRQIAEAGIADRVRLLGFRRDVPDLMRAVDVMCLPSHREPFGLVYVEAALAEKPVIACEAGGAQEIIEHEETGLLVRPQNVPDLTQALLTLLDNRDQAAAMGRRGRELALERFTWSKYLANLRNVYVRVLDRESAAEHVEDRKAA
jgi:glycosyltransferase involved in cell wall biosynthesis